MPVRTFSITGTVTDNKTKAGVANLRVEVWDHEDPGHTLYGAAVTDASGNFDVGATVTIPQVVAGGLPAVVHVFQNQTSLPITGNNGIADLFSQTEPLSLAVTAQASTTPVTDKFTLGQVRSAVDFVRLSDFKGTYQEGKSRVTSSASVLFDSLKSAAGAVQIQPIKPPAVRSTDIVNQDPATATQRLQAQGVQVTDVVAYSPGITNLSLLTSLPKTVKAGQQVQLYQQNGVVKGYQIITPPAPTVDPAAFTQMQANVTDLQTRLTAATTQVATLQIQLTAATTQVNTLQTQLTAKSTQVDQLANQVTTLQTSQALLAKESDLTALQTQLTAKSTQVDQLANQVTTLQTSQAQFAKESDLTALQTQLTAKSTQVDQLATQVTTLQTSQAQFAKESELTALQTQLTAKSTQVDQLANQVTTLQTSQAQFAKTSDVTALQTQVTQISATAAKASSDVNALQTNMSAVKTKLQIA